jgi:hypothetical protein
MDHSAIVKLGRTGLNVTALGFGATAIGVLEYATVARLSGNGVGRGARL